LPRSGNCPGAFFFPDFENGKEAEPMKKNAIGLLLSALCLWTAGAAQADDSGRNTGGKEDAVLFEVGDEPVTRDEFEYVYRKNNPARQNDFSQASLEEYLNLYINFKLKVREARSLRIDTLPGVQAELDRYRKQLVKSYFDKAVTDEMTAAAYDRMMTEVEARHIMIGLQPGASPADTLSALKRIQAIRERLMKGEDFGLLAAELSDDPSAKDNRGTIGYVTGLQIPDSRFEDALFETPQDQVSPPVRTRYGYHLIKPGVRRGNRGTVTVAHLLVKVPEQPTEEQREAARQRALALREQLAAGVSFDSLVRTESDDKSTSARGGLLEPFATGKMIGSFEDAAFALGTPGDISQPVETPYGFHIIRLVERTQFPGYEEMKGEVLRLLQRSGRYDEARRAFVREAHNRFGLEERPEALKAFTASVDSSLLVNTWRVHYAPNPGDTLLLLGGTPLLVQDFAEHVQRSQRAFRDQDIAAKLDRLYDQYLEDNTIEYALGRRDDAFRRLLQEYRDGILLFELTEEKVWQQAMRDTSGLQAFHESRQDNYRWDERVDAVIFTIQDAKTAKKVRKSLEKGADEAAIGAQYNKDGEQSVVRSERGLYLAGANALVDESGRQPGIGPDLSNESGNIIVVQVLEVLPPSPKTLDEARGYVISDYQEYLEKQWVAELRERYPVVVHQAVLQAMIQ
jgi:peptidyl-prolyl cis-trans isomerase SurA